MFKIFYLILFFFLFSKVGFSQPRNLLGVPNDLAPDYTKLIPNPELNATKNETSIVVSQIKDSGCCSVSDVNLNGQKDGWSSVESGSGAQDATIVFVK